MSGTKRDSFNYYYYFEIKTDWSFVSEEIQPVIKSETSQRTGFSIVINFMWLGN